MEEQAIQAFLSIGIVGAALSFGIQWMQDKFGVGGSVTKFISIVGSIVLGGAIWFLQGTEVWASILGVLAAASTVYAMFFSGKRTNDRESV